ncbi:hypothetical protein [Kiloniella laminariae]|uniref:hypothetical protein n=1 Tax=Kiloniella laminariae TaxID=454162 RepID=UPI0003828870|nr:hypothetical protein [Kiloniella laminariae]
MPPKSDIKTDIEFLHSLEEGEVMSQMTLSKRIGVSIGFTNALLKRAINKGYVKAKSAPYKRFAYYLTPRGFSEKSRLVVEYLDSSLGFFKNARRQYVEIFEQAHIRGQNRIILLGAGELAEIAIMAAWDSKVELIAIIDAKSRREAIGNLVVLKTLDEATAYDALVLTDSDEPQATFEKARRLKVNAQLIVPDFLRVHSPDILGKENS